uniref:(northern house mosquito) hypothetical protein n=1 Tax=Culex pipiens TaxID=7175 RepID=A0A8D8BKZ9_CULPI
MIFGVLFRAFRSSTGRSHRTRLRQYEPIVSEEVEQLSAVVVVWRSADPILKITPSARHLLWCALSGLRVARDTLLSLGSQSQKSEDRKDLKDVSVVSFRVFLEQVQD